MSGLLRVKLRRDLRASWPRFLLMVVSIAVSLTVFGGVLFAWNATARETSRAYQSTEPASATIVLSQPIDSDRMAAIATEVRDRPQVIEAAGRTQFESRVEVGGVELDDPMQVFVADADDPMRVAKFDTGPADAWPPADDELFVGRGSLSQLGISVGDAISLTTPGGDAVRLRVAETVYDPSLAPSPSYQKGFGYLSSAALTASGPVRMDQLKVQVADPGQLSPTRDRDTVVAVAGDLGQRLEREYGLAIREIQAPKPYAHPHQWQFDALLGSLLAGGAATLLLSAILVATMLNNVFTQQIPQIGILKAIGARSGRIGRLYLAMTLVVAAAATLLALGPAIMLGRIGADRLPGILEIEPVSLTPAWWTYAVVVAVGLGLPVLIALVPLVRASRTTVRAAIDHRGHGAKPGVATGALARLSRLRRLDRGLLLALRNTVRRPARFLLSVGLLAAAGAVFVGGMSVGSGVQAVTEEQNEQRTWDVDVELPDPVSTEEVTSLVTRIPGVSWVDALNVAKTGVAGRTPVTSTYPDQGHGSTSLIAAPAQARTIRGLALSEGRWLKPRETGAVVLSEVTGKTTGNGVRVGDSVRLFVGGRATTWRVVGIVDEREKGAYTTAEGFAAAMGRPPRVNQLRIGTESHDERSRAAIADAVDAALARAGIDVASAASITRSEDAAEAHTGPIALILVGIAIPLGVIGAIGLAATMSANVLDRIREFGVMHAIGARPRTVRRIVIAEGIVLAVASCIVAVIPALVLTKLLGMGFGNLSMSAPLPFRVSVLAVVIWLAFVILGAILATDTAATRASRITVREALAYL